MKTSKGQEYMILPAEVFFFAICPGGAVGMADIQISVFTV